MTPPAPRNSSHFPIATGAETGQFIAIGFDSNAFGGWREPESPGDAVLQDGHVFVLKLHYTITIVADQMVVLRLLQEIWIVVGLITSQVHLTQKSALDQQGKGPVNGGTRHRAVDVSHPVDQILSIEVLIRAKGGSYDDFTLLGLAQPFAGQEAVELSSGLFVNFWHARRIDTIPPLTITKNASRLST